MLNNFQILKLAPKMGIPLEGVYFKDELTSNDLYPNKSYIINLSDEFDENGNRNPGSHWVALHIGKCDGVITPFYFDSYGIAPAEDIKKIVKKRFKKDINYTTKNVQSIVSDACGWFCLAYLHFINQFYNKTGNIFLDSSIFLDLFEDLDKSVDWKKNEFILKLFFQEPNKKPQGLDKIFQDQSEEDVKKNMLNDITKNDDGVKIDIENSKIRK
tara:strand:+ start:1336 stop:1977 length:642 start_codon:yes stop_codon:yes gene_type:complete